MKRRDLIKVIIAMSNAADKVVNNWERGDLAGAVNNLREITEAQALPAIEWWQEDHD